MNQHTHGDRTIGVWGAIAILIGFVVSVSIFVLPGELAAKTGPMIALSFAVASIPAAFSCAVAAQLGSLYPVSGASYISVANMVSPASGFMCLWLLIGMCVMGLGLLAHGGAGYIQLLIPSVEKKTIALIFLSAIGVMNLFGTRTAVAVQSAMVVIFMIAVVLFCAVGVINIDSANFSPAFPNGKVEIFYAAVPAFFSFFGFMVIIDVGGEIKNPSRNIPIALTVSFVVVLVAYTLMSTSLVGLVPWQQLATTDASISEAASRILPQWAVAFITFATIMAAASTINSTLMIYSRDIQIGGKAEVLPQVLGVCSEKTDSPNAAILLVTGLALILVWMDLDISQYAFFVVLAAMIIQFLVALATLRVKTRDKTRYDNAEFKLSPRALGISCGGLMLSSIVFLAVGIFQSSAISMFLAAYIILGMIYYCVRRSILSSRGTDIAMAYE